MKTMLGVWGAGQDQEGGRRDEGLRMEEDMLGLRGVQPPSGRAPILIHFSAPPVAPALVKPITCLPQGARECGAMGR